MNPVEAKRRIIEEWLKRPVNERREMNIADFYGHLITTGSSLLSFHGPTDRFERIKMWLQPHISS
jgi:hypothetical protein